MACSHKEAIDESARVEVVQEPALVVKEWYPTPKRSIGQPGIAMPPGQVGVMPPQGYSPPPAQPQPWGAAPPQYQAPGPVTQYQAPAPVMQYQAPAAQQQVGQQAPYYQYPPRPWGPQPEVQQQQQAKAQPPVQYNPWQTTTPGWGAVPVYPGWGGPGIWAGAP